MAPENTVSTWYPLRSVTQRLTATPAATLPHIIPYLVTTISGCKDILADIGSQSQKKGDQDASIVVYKLKTQISTLLQDRNKEARWAAVVLVKAIVEAGGWSVLQGSGAWVRSLLGLMGRPEPPTTKKLSIVALTRIFVLTSDNQSLVRDITTPSLPTFISACLRLSQDSTSGNTNPSSRVDNALLSTVLWAFSTLLPRHPRTFKPFLDQIRTLVVPLISSTPSDLPLDGSVSHARAQSCSEIIAQRARHVFVLLNTRALKTAPSQEWERSLSHLISEAHSTADRVFRGLAEDLDPAVWNPSLKTSLGVSLEGICQMIDGESEWPSWKGVHAGIERLVGQLFTVLTYLVYPTSTPVAVPVSKLMGLINRLLSALPPSKGSSNDVSTGTPTKPEISRDEREAVWTWLPSIHVSALQILEQLVVRLEEGSMSLDQRLLDLATWTFEHEHDHVEIRKAVYKILPFLLSRYKGGAQGSTASSLAYCLRICCDDLLSTQGDSEYLQGNVGSTDVTTNKDPMNADAYHKRSDPPSTPSATLNDLQDSAALLLSAALENLPSSFLPSVRSTIDGMAVLSQSQPVLRSSVLNPPARRGRKQQSSVMPFLAQQFPNSPSTEALLRPRMPQLQLNATNHTEDTDEEVDEWEDTTRKPTRLSPEAVSDFKKGNFQASVETDRPETVELGLDSAEARPLSSDPQTYQAHGPDTVLPAKRSREPDTESLSHTASDRPEHLLPPGGEPERKRTRNGGQSLHVPPATEDDVSHPVTKVRSETVLAPTIDVPISAESMGSLWSTNEEIGDDDSDESSVPPIDPTMDTEDEEDEDEDEDEGAD